MSHTLCMTDKKNGVPNFSKVPNFGGQWNTDRQVLEDGTASVVNCGSQKIAICTK